MKQIIIKNLFISSLFFLISSSLHAQTTKDSTTTDNGTVYTKVEFDAEFPGEMEGWKNFLIKELDPDVPVKKGAPVGSYRVIIRFIVSADGSLSNFQKETNFGYGMEDECINVLKKSPKWQPAMQNGKAVNAYKRQPITFIVEGK